MFMFFALILLTIVVTITILTLLWKQQQKKTRHSLVTRAKGYPIIGNLLDFLLLPDCDGLAIFTNYTKQYGKFVELHFGLLHALLISDLEIGKEILNKRPKKFHRGKNNHYAIEVLGTESGLFFAEGHLWTKIRKSSSSAFAKLNLSNQFIKIVDEVNDWMKRIDDEIQKNPQHVVDMKKEALSLTIRVITIVAFGLETTDPLCSYFFSQQFKQDMLDGFSFIGQSSLWPFPRWLWKYSSKYALELKGKAALDRVVEKCQIIIDSKRKNIALNNSVNNSSLQYSSMMDSYLYHEYNSTEKALTDREIITNVQGIYSAGADSTSIVTTWMAFYLSQYPQYHQRIQREASEVFFRGQAKTSEHLAAITLDTLQELPFTTAFVKETLRLRGPAPVMSVEAGEEVILSNGIPIYPNETVWIYFENFHCDEIIFEDPFTFRPDRWLVNDAEKLRKMENAFMPFGHGPRVCPGMYLAMHEMILAVGFLASHYRIELCCTVEEIKRVNHFLFQPSQMPVRFIPL